MGVVYLAQRPNVAFLVQTGWLWPAAAALSRQALLSEHNLCIPVLGCESRKTGLSPHGALQVV